MASSGPTHEFFTVESAERVNDCFERIDSSDKCSVDLICHRLTQFLRKTAMMNADRHRSEGIVNLTSSRSKIINIINSDKMNPFLVIWLISQAAVSTPITSFHTENLDFITSR